MLAVAVPLLLPLQVTEVELILTANPAGWLIVADVVVLHPLLSVTVTV